MQQLSTNFDDSGDLAMNTLTYFNTLGSPDLRKQQAMIIADQLDHIFRIGRGAKYEANVDRTKAMNSMVKILIDEKKLLKDLAQTIDDSYKFWGESTLLNQ
ncbi:hypothetical protein NIASO_00450 [Niabella soli DSM 19437]|uniref:Uncharacterized protein n=2 Tax=Niabella TaxID=379899 RepID=W0F6E1_9BACT|nr:hypothetical protein NIASO_00450 [Niabella soli DSM 19437]